MHVQEMYRRLTGLVVFRRLLQDPVVAACGEMLSARVRGDSGDFSAACAGFEAALFQSSDSWSCYLREAVLESENVCIRGQAVGRSSVLQESLRRGMCTLPGRRLFSFCRMAEEGRRKRCRPGSCGGDMRWHLTPVC